MQVTAKVTVQKEWSDVWQQIAPVGVPSKSDKTIKKFIHNASSDSMTHNASNNKMVSANCIQRKVLDWSFSPEYETSSKSKKYPVSSIETTYEILESAGTETVIKYTLSYGLSSGVFGKLISSMATSVFMKNLAKRNLDDLCKTLNRKSNVAA